MVAPMGAPCRIAQIGAQNCRKRIAVGKVEPGQRRDGDIEIKRIDAGAELAATFACAHNVGKARVEYFARLADRVRCTDHAPAQVIFRADDPFEIGMVRKILHREALQLFQAAERIGQIEIERPLLGT